MLVLGLPTICRGKHYICRRITQHSKHFKIPQIQLTPVVSIVWWVHTWLSVRSLQWSWHALHWKWDLLQIAMKIHLTIIRAWKNWLHWLSSLHASRMAYGQKRHVVVDDELDEAGHVNTKTHVFNVERESHKPKYIGFNSGATTARNHNLCTLYQGQSGLFQAKYVSSL